MSFYGFPTISKPAGTSFPGLRSVGDRFFRSDLGWMCFFDGLRWLTDFELSMQVQTITFTGSTAKALAAFRTDYSPLITRVRLGYYIYTTNDATNYWNIAYRLISAAYSGATVIKSYSTAAASPNTWTAAEDPPTNATSNTNRSYLDFNITKNSSPGDIDIVGSVFYRLIVP